MRRAAGGHPRVSATSASCCLRQFDRQRPRAAIGERRAKGNCSLPDLAGLSKPSKDCLVSNAVFGQTWTWPVAQERQLGREVSRREDRLPETFRSGSSGRVRPQPRSFQFHGRAGLWPGSCDFDGSIAVASSQVRLGSRAHGRRIGPLLLPRSKSEREYDQGDAKGDGVRAHPPSQDESSD